MELNKDFLAIGVAQGASICDVSGTYGTFVERAHVNIKIDAGVDNQPRRFAVRSMYTILGHSAVKIEESVSDYQGFDVTMIDDDGYFNPSAMMAVLKNTSMYGGQELVDKSRLLTALDWKDNQDALLYSLICSAATAEIAKNKEDYKMIGVIPNYDDGHIAFSRRKLYGLTEIAQSVDLTTWPFTKCDNTEVLNDITFHGKFRNWEWHEGPNHDCVMDMRGLGADEAAFVLWHLFKKDRTTEFAWDAPMPQLVGTGNNVVTIYGVTVHPENFTNARQFKCNADKIWQIIAMYVGRNRLEASFTRAQYLWTQVAATPVPTHAEGHMWTTIVPTVILPKFYARRGRMSVILGGNPYDRHPNQLVTPQQFRMLAGAKFMIAARVKAAAYWGLYRYMKKNDVHSYQTYLTVDGNPVNDTGIENAALIAFATGRNVALPLLGNEGVVLGVSKMIDYTRNGFMIEVEVRRRPLRGYITVEDEGMTKIMAIGPQWPGATAAAIGHEWLVNEGSALWPVSEVTTTTNAAGAYVEHSNAADKLAAYYRWAGYDVTFSHPGIPAWTAFASNEDQTVPTVLVPRAQQDYLGVLKIEKITERENNFISMPTLARDTAFKITCTITRLANTWTSTTKEKDLAMSMSVPTRYMRATVDTYRVSVTAGMMVSEGYILPPKEGSALDLGFQTISTKGSLSLPAAAATILSSNTGPG